MANDALGMSSSSGGGGGASNDSSRVLNMVLDGLNRLGTKVDANQEKIEAKFDTMAAAIRTQIDAGDEKRLSKDVFEEYKRGTDDRLARLEQSPMRVLAWIGFATGLVGGPLLTIVLYVLSHR